MKTIRLFILFLLPVLLLASCNGPLQIEKRHYRNGFYVDFGRVKNETAPVAETAPFVKPVEQTSTAVNEEPILVQKTNVAGTMPVAKAKKNELPVRITSERAPAAIKEATGQTNNPVASAPPGDDETAAKNKNTVVTILMALTGVALLLALIFGGTTLGLIAVFLAPLLGLTALGIYFEKKKDPMKQDRKERKEKTHSEEVQENVVLASVLVVAGLVVLSVLAIIVAFLVFLGGF